MIKKIVRIVLGLIILLIVIIIVNTLMLKSKQIEVIPVNKISIGKSSIDHLSEAIRFETISHVDTSLTDWKQFRDFIHFIETTYPQINNSLTKEIINNYSLLYKWEGKNINLKPVVLIAHYDVVPIEEESLSEWKEDPFGGKIDNKFIWGRGTMDDKLSVVGILEAVELLLKEGVNPERTIYFAFGHDEEILGQHGAKQIVKNLESKNVIAEFVLDEGLIIVRPPQVKGIKKDVALIGVSEKGYITVELSVNMDAGHSSMPPEETAVGVMSKAIVRLRENQPKAKVSEPIRGFFKYIGPEMPFHYKAVFANTWLFKKIILNIYKAKPASNALVRTTTSPTIFKSGIQANVLPLSAKATINFRILPGETIDGTITHVKNIVDDERIKIYPSPNFVEPSPVAPIDTYGFNTINTTIRQVFPETLVGPSLVNALTDARHYYNITDNIYHFLPYTADEVDLKRYHGVNERLSIEGFKDCIRFYYQLIRNCNN